METAENILGITVAAKDQASSQLNGVNKALGGIATTSQSMSKVVTGVGIAIAGVGAGLTALSKNATNSVVDYTKSVISLDKQTGLASDDASRLLFAFEHFGVSAGETSTTLGLFAKQITAASDKSTDLAKTQDALNNKIADTQAKISANTTAIKTNVDEGTALQTKLKAVTDEMAKNGDANGALAAKAQALRDQIQKNADASVTLSQKTKDLTTDMNNYKDSVNNAGSPLQALGVATTNADGTQRSFNDILLDTADKFKAMPDGAAKTTLAIQLFGRSGKDLIPVLDQGSQGIQALGDEADKLGITLTASNLGSVQKYIQGQKDLKASQEALTMQIGLAAIPMWQKLTSVTNEALTKLLQAPQPIRGIVTGFAAFGGPVLTATGSLLGFLANLDQAKGAILAIIGVIRTAGAALLGPWGVAIAVAGAAIAGITWLIDKHKHSQDADLISTGGLSTAIQLQGNSIQDASKKVYDANFAAEGATINVMEAQQNYNQALAEFGPNSVEALSAAHDLQGAKDDLATADDTAASAQQNLVNWEQMIPLNTAAVTTAIDTRTGAYSQMSAVINTVTTQAENLDNIITTVNGASLYNVTAGLQVANGLAVQVQKAVSAAQSAGVSLQGSSASLQGSAPAHRAMGGPVLAGHSYVVGENRPEMFVPDRNGTIQPSVDKSGPTINQYNTINSQVDLDQVTRDLAWRLQKA